MNKNSFPLRLKELREEKGLSQVQLAKDLCLSQPAIAKWESGARKPDIDLVIKIAKYFNTTTDFLLGLED